MTGINGICPVCEALRPLEIRSRQESQQIKKQIVEGNVEYSHCLECGSEFVTSQQMEKNLEAFRDAYRLKNDIITPGEIIHLREKYGVSQKTMGKLLDLGELTINSYEQGAIPSGAHNNLLKLMRDPDNFIRMYDEHKNRLSETQQRKIEKQLYKIPLQSRMEYAFQSDKTRELCCKESPYSGYHLPR